MQKTWRSHLMAAYSLAILAFLYLPLLILAMYSFNESRINAVWTGFTFNWYEALFQNRRVLEALTNSLFIAVISTIASTTLGTIAAIALNRYQYKYKPVINGLLYLPILIPEIVMGLSLLVLFAQAQVPLGKTTLILAHITFCVSFVVITVNARLEGMRHELEQAAMDLPLRHLTAGPAWYRGRRPDRLHAVYRRFYYQLLCGRPQFYYAAALHLRYGQTWYLPRDQRLVHTADVRNDHTGRDRSDPAAAAHL